MYLNLAILYLLIVYCLHNVLCQTDLYDVLGVKKSASTAEIKRAYKKLARKWHPDKNQEEGAEDRFIRINEAYETLSNEKDRSQYDRFGKTTAQNQQPGHGGGGFHEGFQHFGGDPFSHFSFTFGGHSESSLNNYRITLRSYNTRVIPESKKKPYLIYAYSGFCFRCMQMEPIWNKVVEDLETIGLGIGTLHVQMDSGLTNKLSISSIPAVIAVVDGRTRWFEGELSVASFREFIRSLFPSQLVTTLTDDTYESFLSGWSDNRVRMLLAGKKLRPTLRFLAAAFACTASVAAAYVNLNPSVGSTVELRKRYNLATDKESLLIFSEDITRPLASVNMPMISRKTMDEMVESHPYLSLPRISCQNIFNQLCPVYSPARSKKLCIVLLTHHSPVHDEHRRTFRQFANAQADSTERARYAYLHSDVQKSFVNSLSAGHTENTSDSLPVVVLWRLEGLRMQYTWLDGGWSATEGLHDARLTELVDWLLNSKAMLPLAVTLPNELLDEQAGSLLYRMIQRISVWSDAISDKVFSIDMATIVTIIATIAFVFIVGLLAKTAINVEETRVSSSQQWNKMESASKDSTVYLHPFGPDNMQRLVLRPGTGVRTIMVLVDGASKDVLIQRFARAVHPYSRSAGFVFSFLDLEHYLGWFRTLLSATTTMPVRDLSAVRIESCVGTVLALNGQRHYYCLFHPNMKTNGPQKRRVMDRILGFSDDDGDSSDNELASSAGVDPKTLRGLANWLDRLCEGSTKRYRVDEWPVLES